jgi:acyl-[acyl-carrier-protein]-phospholipid O-acyltransferase/long-chain-fatty-acid--[acyl-carrier-protein] ligase
VVEVPDALRGAKIVAAITHRIDEKSILKQMSEKLPPIALPSKFVIIEEMPKAGTGKLDFRAITDMVRDIIQGRS